MTEPQPLVEVAVAIAGEAMVMVVAIVGEAAAAAMVMVVAIVGMEIMEGMTSTKQILSSSVHGSV